MTRLYQAAHYALLIGALVAGLPLYAWSRR